MVRAAIYFLRTWFLAPENGVDAAALPPQSKSGAGGRWWRGIFAGDAGLAGEKGAVWGVWQFVKRPMILTKLNQIKPNKGEGVCGGRLITGVCRRWTVGGLWAVVAGESGAEASALQTLARWPWAPLRWGHGSGCARAYAKHQFFCCEAAKLASQSTNGAGLAI
jgi:hypothetical protein